MNKMFVGLMFIFTIYVQHIHSYKVYNLRPIIGIVSQKVSEPFTPDVTKADTYIAASYVKQLEMAGAQVVPILPTYSEKKKKQIIKSINGVLFPGGAAPINESGYFKTAKLVFNEAKKLNDAGHYYPIWGTCLGFETLHSLVAEEGVLDHYDAENLSIPLNLTKEAFKSRMLEGMAKRLIQSLMFDGVTLNMHNMGVHVKQYTTNKKLQAFFRVLSTNNDRNGKEFISTVEGINYPFYGTQWHPEKNIFEWTHKEAINHSPSAIEITQHLSNFFVGEARKNNLKFANEKEEIQNLIFKYAPVYSGGASLFEQVYIFGNKQEKYIS